MMNVVTSDVCSDELVASAYWLILMEFGVENI